MHKPSKAKLKELKKKMKWRNKFNILTPLQKSFVGVYGMDAGLKKCKEYQWQQMRKSLPSEEGLRAIMLITKQISGHVYEYKI